MQFIAILNQETFIGGWLEYLRIFSTISIILFLVMQAIACPFQQDSLQGHVIYVLSEKFQCYLWIIPHQEYHQSINSLFPDINPELIILTSTDNNINVYFHVLHSKSILIDWYSSKSVPLQAICCLKVPHIVLVPHLRKWVMDCMHPSLLMTQAQILTNIFLTMFGQHLDHC